MRNDVSRIVWFAISSTSEVKSITYWVTAPRLAKGRHIERNRNTWSIICQQEYHRAKGSNLRAWYGTKYRRRSRLSSAWRAQCPSWSSQRDLSKESESEPSTRGRSLSHHSPLTCSDVLFFFSFPNTELCVFLCFCLSPSLLSPPPYSPGCILNVLPWGRPLRPQTSSCHSLMSSHCTPCICFKIHIVAVTH